MSSGSTARSAGRKKRAKLNARLAAIFIARIKMMDLAIDQASKSYARHAC